MRDRWWEKSVIYQIYPISFADSDGDGRGDLKGILSRLDYLEGLGIGAVWLNPVYDSPDVDMGYDIRDYRKIHPRYGTMEDMKELIRGLHERGMRLIMDLVVNHTSDQHEWFVEASASRESEYHDYYIWQEGSPDVLPSDMGSFFTPSCWKYNEPTGEWYLHLFAEEQPDLNWENPKVRKDVYEMIRFWQDLGVDGFRMDVIDLIAKELKLDHKSTEPSGMLYPEQFACRPKLHDYLKELRRECAKPGCDFFLGETPFTDDDDVDSLLRNGDELEMLFQFDFMDADKGEEKWDVRPLDLIRMKASLAHWQHKLGNRNSVFWSNHDQARPISRYISPKNREEWILSGKMLGVAMHFLQGTSFVYQGEEIGMMNYQVLSESDLFDIESVEYIRALPDEEKERGLDAVAKRGRENARSPMQWNGHENAGFTCGVPWCPVNPSYKEINVETENSDDGSILNFYRKILYMKTHDPVLVNGSFESLLDDDPDVFAYERIYGDTIYTVICNFTGRLKNLDSMIIQGETVLSNYSTSAPELRPYEVRVMKK